MKINNVNSGRSFGALMLECKPMSKNQKEIIRNIKKTVLEDKYNIHLIESRYTDVYISPNDDKKSVDLKLRTAAGLTYNYVPCDDDREVKMNISSAPANFDNTSSAKKNLSRDIAKKTRLFMQRALDCIIISMNTPENQSKMERLENISSNDLLINRISHPEKIPYAVNLYGNPQVTTR